MKRAIRMASYHNTECMCTGKLQNTIIMPMDQKYKEVSGELQKLRPVVTVTKFKKKKRKKKKKTKTKTKTKTVSTNQANPSKVPLSARA